MTARIEPKPTDYTISKHVRQQHGYSMEDSLGPTKLLVSEHNRIHSALAVDHEHETVEA